MSSATGLDRCSEPTLFLIASTPRTGSNLLTHALNAVGLPQVEELFSRACLADAGVMDKLGDDSALRNYLVREIEQYTGLLPWGMKIFWHHVQDYGLQRLITSLLCGQIYSGRVAVILGYRRDVTLQAVSVLRAYASGRFASCAGNGQRFLYDDAFWGAPGVVAAARRREASGDIYDFDDLFRIIRCIEQGNRAWRSLFADSGISYHAVCYEDLADNLPDQIASVLRYLEVARALPDNFRAPLRVQRDKDSYQLAERFRQDRMLINLGERFDY
jgi:LPS sulfotransferase NodH